MKISLEFESDKEMRKMFESVICGSIEGGSWWYGVDNTIKVFEDRKKGTPLSEFVWELLLSDKEVELYDLENEDEIFHLTKEKMIKGFEVYLKEKGELYNIENCDGYDSDAVIQYALFGELVYG